MTLAIRPTEVVLAALTLLLGVMWGAAAFWLVLYGQDIPTALSNGDIDWIDQQAGLTGLLILVTAWWVRTWWRAYSLRPATAPFRRFILIGVPVAFTVFAIQSFADSRAIFDTF
jgi:hypothetical protein